MKARILAHVENGHHATGDGLAVHRAVGEHQRALGQVIEAEAVAGDSRQLLLLAIQQPNGAGLGGRDVDRGFGNGAQHLSGPQSGADGSGDLQQAGGVLPALLELGEEAGRDQADEVEQDGTDDDVLQGLRRVAALGHPQGRNRRQHGRGKGGDNAAYIPQKVAGRDDGDIVEMNQAALGAAVDVHQPRDQ